MSINNNDIENLISSVDGNTDITLEDTEPITDRYTIITEEFDDVESDIRRLEVKYRDLNFDYCQLQSTAYKWLAFLTGCVIGLIGALAYFLIFVF